MGHHQETPIKKEDGLVTMRHHAATRGYHFFIISIDPNHGVRLVGKNVEARKGLFYLVNLFIIKMFCGKRFTG
jgi:hypothetical protein